MNNSYAMGQSHTLSGSGERKTTNIFGASAGSPISANGFIDCKKKRYINNKKTINDDELIDIAFGKKRR